MPAAVPVPLCGFPVGASVHDGTMLVHTVLPVLEEAFAFHQGDFFPKTTSSGG